MKILVLPGDGIGPEITDATLTVLDAASKKFSLGLKYDTQQVGLAALKSHGTTMPDGLLGPGLRVGRDHARAARPDGVSGAGEGRDQRVGGVRVKLDLYANLRPARSRPGIGKVKEAMDLVIVRECTEGFYADRNMYQGAASSCRRRTWRCRCARSRRRRASASRAGLSSWR
jgi:3-isopropylmalate dehydrogenase